LCLAGCITYELAALRPPFEALSQRELAVKIRHGAFPRLPSQYSDALDALIR
jgi:NIMA (never in mitosis gene a)-related kinase